MYKHWFASLGISQQDWKESAAILRNNLPKDLNEQEYNDLKGKLSIIDTTDERSKASEAVKPKNLIICINSF